MDFPVLWMMSICLFPSMSTVNAEVRCNKKSTQYKHLDAKQASYHHSWNMSDMMLLMRHNNCASQVLVKTEVPVYLNVVVEWVHKVHLSTHPEMALQLAYNCDTQSSCIGAVITLNVTSYPSSRCYACLLPSSSSASSVHSTRNISTVPPASLPSTSLSTAQLTYLSFSNLLALQLILDLNQLTNLAPSMSQLWLSATVHTSEGPQGNHRTCVRSCGWLEKCQNKACEDDSGPSDEKHATKSSSIIVRTEPEGRVLISVEALLAILITLCIFLIIVVALIFLRCISFHRLQYHEPHDIMESTHHDLKNYEKPNRLTSLSTSSFSIHNNNNGVDKCTVWLAHGSYNVSSSKRHETLSRTRICSPYNGSYPSHGPLPPPPQRALLSRPECIPRPTAQILVKNSPSENTALTPLAHFSLPSQASTPACSGSDAQTFSEVDATTPQSNTDTPVSHNHKNYSSVQNGTTSRSFISTSNSMKYSLNPLHRVGASFEVPPNQFPFESSSSQRKPSAHTGPTRSPQPGSIPSTTAADLPHALTADVLSY